MTLIRLQWETAALHGAGPAGRADLHRPAPWTGPRELDGGLVVGPSGGRGGLLLTGAAAVHDGRRRPVPAGGRCRRPAPAGWFPRARGPPAGHRLVPAPAPGAWTGR